MAGHSKWNNIKRRKGAQDAKRGKVFQKMSREIYVAAKSGGADPEMNPTLRLAVEKSKGMNVPNDVIQRAIDKATGADDDAHFDEVVYEGYGPGGIAVLVYTLTDNRNRTATNIRTAFNKNGGNLGEDGSVSYMFNRKGRIMIERTDEIDEDMLMLEALEAGAEDIESSEEGFEIITDPQSFIEVKEALEQAGFSFASSEIEMIPTIETPIAPEHEESFEMMIETLEDDDDVQDVYHNGIDAE